MWLHTFTPQPEVFTIGSLTVYWYGLLMAVAIATGILIAVHLAKRRGLAPHVMWDLAFWVVLFGIIGARVYEVVLVDPSYYFTDFTRLWRIWDGGMAIHGGLIFGGLTTWWFARKYKLPVMTLLDILAPAVALGQVIGRWGNYFNQELFGAPTSLFWGIPIALDHRPLEYINFTYFHPTFLYESLGCLLIFGFLWYLHARQAQPGKVFLWYVLWYSILRFTIEFIRLDPALMLGSIRWPQVISVVLIIASAWGLWRQRFRPQTP
jgi:phosphatidylglycerol---prolipoprotein diacylglyceryl transferase